MNEHISHHIHPPRHPDAADGTAPDSTPPDGSIPVGDVYVRRDGAGYGIFNYRGERVLDAPLRTSEEAARLAREIVSSWEGHVVVDDPSDE